MTERTRFPNARVGDAFVFDHDGLSYHAVINRFEDGTPGEIFIDAGRVGSTAHTLGKEAAVLFSLARQYGAPMEIIRAALPHLADDSPAGPMDLALSLAEAANQ